MGQVPAALSSHHPPPPLRPLPGPGAAVSYRPSSHPPFRSGPVATRSLTAATHAHVRPAAVAALWAVGGDPAEVMPLLLGLLDDGIVSEAADVLGEIGPPAAAALPRLRELLTDDYEWVRVHSAAALWEIGGEAEAPAVLDTLLQAWAQNPSTANHVVTCLDRMETRVARAALPRRGGRFRSVDHDEELQRLGRALIARLDPPAPEAPAPRRA
ncbi:HEAT repeat domain-containing protein [Streptomyces sp. NPDC050743]|uniref:HEAT repeat domain-containing protein n=1 Tax=Streptomyces sp. NPDC050743 TaxID=3365634 RepID=UPI003787EBC6